MNLRSFTPTGLGVLLLVAAGFGVGWWLGWIEFVAMATAGLIAIGLAIPFVLGQHRLVVTRLLAPNRVSVGDEASAVLTISNPGRGPIPKQVLSERVGDRSEVVAISGLGPYAEVRRVIPLPTDRRGHIVVGPTTVTKGDPLGLLATEVEHTSADELWVHPQMVPVRPVPLGFAKDLEGPTTDSSPAGDVSFHALREYSIGDDPRHVHWLATARSSNLMVKHYVDNRLPHTTVVLDPSVSAYSGDEFELGVSALASLGVAGLLDGQPTSAYLGERPIVSSQRPLPAEEFLDQLCLLEVGEEQPSVEQCLRVLENEKDTSVLVFITGAAEASELLALATPISKRVHLIVLRVWPSSDLEPVSVPGATVLDADTIDRFAAAWNQAVS